MMFEDGSNAPTAAPSASGPAKQDISSQAVDSVPLTEPELFPQPTITPVPEEPPYQVIKTQALEDCTQAAADELGALLIAQGCTQVVRGTMKHPTGNYLVTAGLFNLKDADTAQQAHDGIKPILDAKKGRFNGLAAPGADAIMRAETQLGWNISGHYLAYCVIARTDGQAFEDSDGYPKQIIFDIVDTYLTKGVIAARENAPAAEASAAGEGGGADPTAPPSE